MRLFPILLLVLALWSEPLRAGPLSGQILDAGVTAVLEDVIQLPASSGGIPRARVNVLR